MIGEKQLQRFKYDDPHALLTQVPGLYVRQEDWEQYSPRSFNELTRTILVV